MKIKNFILIVLIKILVFSSGTFANEKLKLCGNDIMQHIYENDDRNFEYLETRNDSGIHFLYDWNKDDKIIIKRNENNFPIISYSLFESENFIPSKTVVKKTVARLAGSDNLLLTMRVDPSLIGGLVVRIGSRMIDTSIKTKLSRLESAMKGVA